MAGRHRGAVRQLSLQIEDKRKVLRKQRSSEDGRRSVFEARAPSEATKQMNDVWSEDEKPVEVVATRCGQPRPVQARPPRSPLVPDQRTLAASRQEIAKRLRQAWAKSHNSNLEIYLTQDGDDDDPTITPRTQVGCPTPDLLTCTSDTVTQTDSNKENRSSNVQVLEINALCKEPVNPSDSTDCSPYMSEEEDPPGDPLRSERQPRAEEPPPAEKVPSCRLTAEERRMNFRNGYKRAISTSVSSTPPATPIARRSPTVLQRPESRPSSAKATKKPPTPQVKRKLKKRRSRDSKYGGGELVTMVSLVSPAESEAEDSPPPCLQPCLPPPCLDATKPPNPPPPAISLNKRPPLKAVAGMKSSSLQGAETTLPPPPPRLPPAQPLPDPLIRRNNQTNNVARTRSILRGSPGMKIEVTEKKTITFEVREEKAKEEVKCQVKVKEEECRAADGEKDLSDREESEKSEMRFVSPKEKECWDLFNKISQKGIPVSFDTILRGMLTPTEYRLRKNALSR